MRFYLDLAGGLVVHDQFLLGVQAGGWLLEAADPEDPTRGAAVSPLFLGYDIRAAPHVDITPFTTYFQGRVGNLHFRAITAGAGVTFRQAGRTSRRPAGAQSRSSPYLLAPFTIAWERAPRVAYTSHPS